MPLLVNLRLLEAEDLALTGELTAEELDLDSRDEMIRAEKPLRYHVTVQNLEDSLLAQGRLVLPLQCQCVRCLKAFEHRLELPGWTLLLPLEGEDKAEVHHDCVDLTPYLREDILLAFPQHPLCGKNCRGLPKPVQGKAKPPSGDPPKPSAWAALDKLKIDRSN